MALCEERLNYEAHKKIAKTAFFERLKLVIDNKKVYNSL
jgi:hypothetical protein